ncbi:sulfurtransferase [Leifsonia sp. 1010]|uniref:sulfurtransferase n=1 Tax=Leifsonia sp. 1010 TaxID=2817769 RepID=UPI0028599150|nr:sulfurtransferase [Leifsonia sp. 1010]MDR6613752.1 thiosulfate/3-mercaptopyruvate sulfurtransferase [Leifsonia sp. 1010]
MATEISPLITAAALDVALGAESLWSGAGRRRSAWRVLDVRWKLGGPPGREEFERGHIPGAVYVDLDTELAGHGEPTDGRHPLPSQDAFQEAARRWGLGDGDSVVVYDDASGSSAARAWWLLRHAGVRDVRVLDGGIAAWRDAGMPLEKGPGATPIPGSIHVQFGALPTLDGDAAAALAVAADAVLLDARAGERFRGEVEPVDPRPGHIPGAVSAPTTDNVDADGRMLPADALAERFRGLGIDADTPVGVYCGSGVTAAHEALAMVIAGLPLPALYAGSYSAWSNDPERPVVTGA